MEDSLDFKYVKCIWIVANEWAGQFATPQY